MAGEVGAMENMQPKGHGRANIINAFMLSKLARGRDGYRGGGGKSKRDWENESKFLEYQYRLKDEEARARAANEVEVTANNRRNLYDDSAAMSNAGNGGGGQTFSTDVHNPTSVRAYDSPDELLIQDQNGNKYHAKNNRPAGGPAGEPMDGPAEDLPEDSPEGNGDPGTTQGPWDPFANRKVKKATLIAGDKKEIARIGEQKMLPAQLKDARENFDPYYQAKLEEARAAGVEMDPELQEEVTQEFIRNSNPFSERQVEALTSAQRRQQQDWIRGNPADAKVVAPQVGDADENGAPHVGDQGNRSAPSGESGVPAGPQFTPNAGGTSGQETNTTQP